MPQFDSTYRWLPDPNDFLMPWAHGSGWKLQYGSMQKVSCVIPCRNQRRRLTLLLPQLSDMLIETGLDWEVLLVDAGSDDGSDSLLRQWSREPGFRVASAKTRVHRAEAIVAGLTASRGDIAIVLDANARYQMSLVREAVELCLSGAQVAFATHEGGDRIVVLEQVGESATHRPREVIDSSDFGAIAGGLVILGRPIVQALLDKA